MIHNATFMIEREREEEFVAWLRGGLPRLGALANVRLTSMREAGGVDYREAEAQSVALQSEFATVEAARRWSVTEFASFASRFEEAFGPQAMVFTSIFEVIEL